MGFTQPCFIRKNSPELRQRLVDLGYNRYPIWMIGCNEDDDSVYLVIDGVFYKFPTKYLEDNMRDDVIDCEENEEMFLALAALRDDSNEHQWFIALDTVYDENYNGEINVYYEKGEWLLWGYYSLMEDMPSDFRKATAEEIVEHFMKK